MPAEIPSAAVAAEGVGHRFGDVPALRDCTFAVPPGAVVALLGRNGAGKTTLLRAVVGLLRPYRGRIRVFGEPAGAGVLPRIGYVAQQAPLYRMLTVEQTLRLGARLNPHFDAGYARRLVDAGPLPVTARVGALAAGQRARLALAVALGKRPDLLVLDEPLASLDPVARTEFVGALMAEVADRGTTVLMSTHVVADVQDVCDHVVVLGGGQVRLAAEVEPALAAHRLAVGAERDLGALDGLETIEVRRDGGEFTALVATAAPPDAGTVTWHRPTLEELLLGYLRTGAPHPSVEVSLA
ncbi:ABC transporter ATP-binding protein [Jidongwangia harbinensis]|uniref:ABC transporter ATP-binding protein n=1 Tax=Jidongwangia harbinensis TaxID=2878561 RepID=UPI001CDA1305|nr:ATP-binding cassette domain-containing protein [Jidongwangia harbinensis]MCA2219272.1 ATP-binding cassette domain-containing protein [Jidongwangia harbinensis]